MSAARGIEADGWTISDGLLVTTGDADARRDLVACEVPVALRYNSRPFAVMLPTPVDLDDFARGFSVTEGIVASPADIAAIEVVPVPRGIAVGITIDEALARAMAGRKRVLTGRTGCGLCGADQLSEVFRPLRRVEAPLRIRPEAVRRAVTEMPGLQSLNRLVGAVHAAAFAGPDGRVRILREDVGRHNALDKLHGALARSVSRTGAAGVAGAGPVGADGFVLVTSRVSVEMVQKTAALGAPVLVALSAPTALAIRTAEQAGLTLVAVARRDGFEVFTRAERIG